MRLKVNRITGIKIFAVRALKAVADLIFTIKNPAIYNDRAGGDWEITVSFTGFAEYPVPDGFIFRHGINFITYGLKLTT